VFYIGAPIWSYKGWVGNFFPASTPSSDYLRLYSRRLNAVEGNTVFYALPSSEVIARWNQETPATFRICPKVPRSISHAHHLESNREETMLVVERLSGLGVRLGPMFLQLPPSFGPAQLSALEAFLEFWPTNVRLAVEVRHTAFFEVEHAATLNTLLSQYRVARVMMDTRPIRIGSGEEKQVLQARERKPNLPLQIAVTTDFVFVRYIGHPRMEVNEPLLDSWAHQLAEWLQGGLTAYVFCHCPFEVHSPAICYALYQRVRARVPLPPLSWQSELPAPKLEQGRLF
jgi:uncharacterized protein YecE (DUF72 family)